MQALLPGLLARTAAALPLPTTPVQTTTVPPGQPGQDGNHLRAGDTALHPPRRGHLFYFGGTE